MAKPKTAYACTECGGRSSKWQGQCPHCGAWNTLVETVATPAATRFHAVAGAAGEVRQLCPLDAAGEQLMRAASRQMHLSARSHHRIIKLARTIADLAAADQISASHIAEALQYRPRELTV